MGPCYSCDGAEFSVAPQGIDAVKLLSWGSITTFSSYAYVWSEHWRLLNFFPGMLKATWDAVVYRAA